MIYLYFTLIENQPSRRAMHAAQHRAGRLLLCGALRLSEEALSAALAYRENGKPYLPGGPFFNISHSGRLVLLAVSAEGEIGCDVEDIARPVRSEAAIREKVGGDENEPLLKLWVRHEARRKAGGPGWIFMPEIAEGYVAAVCAKNHGEIAIEQKYFEI